MAQLIQKPYGTHDVLPEESWQWQLVEQQIRDNARCFGYREMRLPTFESTELFSRGVGETTDIVNKEMYTFEDKKGRSLTLRPEGTAGVVRATLEHGLLASSPLPLKAYYLQSCFRYEREQAGRQREFHQFGIECFGTHEPVADMEAMAVAYRLFEKLSVLDAITLEINSIGCPVCRPAYNQKLVAYFEGKKDELCPLCLERLEKNPMRILDCKEERCGQIAKDAPVMLDSLCEDCADHFEQTKALLDEADMLYVVNPHIVRGLDYYTNTVFEFLAEIKDGVKAVCAGGRYDGLIGELGGQPTPAVGFGMGIERVLILLDESGNMPAPPEGPLLYAVGLGDAGRAAARKLTALLRDAGYSAECDLANRSVKAQMKAAGRSGARFSVVLGDDEVQNGKAALKDMRAKQEFELALDEPWETLIIAMGADGDAPAAQNGKEEH